MFAAVGTFIMGIWASWRAAFRAPAGAWTLLVVWASFVVAVGTSKKNLGLKMGLLSWSTRRGNNKPDNRRRRRRGVADAAAPSRRPRWTGKVPIAFTQQVLSAVDGGRCRRGRGGCRRRRRWR